MASSVVIPYDKHVLGFNGVLDSVSVYLIYHAIIKYFQKKFPNCSIAFIQDRLAIEGKVYLQLFLTLLFFGRVPLLIGRCRRDFKAVGKLWLSYKKLDDTSKKSFSPCYEYLSKCFRQKMTRSEENQDAVDRFAINTWFQVQQLGEDQCKERKRILYDMLHSIPEGADRSLVEIVFYSKMATTAEFENDIDGAKDFASRAKYLSEICYDKTAKILAHYAYFFLHRRLYLRDKSTFNRKKALEQCTIGCNMFPVPDEDGDFEMYCALLFLLYKAEDYLQITYEFDVPDTVSVTKENIGAAEEILKSVYKYISTATPRKILSYTYCMGRLHHLKSDFETASKYLQEAEALLSPGMLKDKDKANISRYCRGVEEELRDRKRKRHNSDEEGWFECPGYNKKHATATTLKEFQSSLIELYKDMPEIIAFSNSLKNVTGKVRTTVIPIFVPVLENKLKDKGQLDKKLFQSLCDWVQSLYLDQDKSQEMITITGEPGEISYTYAVILKTWIDSISNEESLLLGDSGREYYDVVLHCKGLPHNTSHNDIISLVCHHLAEKLKMTHNECRDILSRCRKCLLLLEDVPRSCLPEFQVGSIHSTVCANENLSKYSVICANTNTEDLLDEFRLFNFANKFNTRGGRQVTVTLKDENGLTSKDGLELKNWFNGYLAYHSSSESQHNACFSKMKAEAESEDISITLAPAAHVEALELSNCDQSFVVVHDAKTLLVRGKSILALDRSLKGSCTIDTLYLCFEHDFEGQDKCHMFDEFITENILASVDKCPLLQRIELRNLSFGRRMDINHRIKRSMIEHLRDETNIKRNRTRCSFLLWPCLKQFDFEKRDFDYETSKFAKAVILDVICQKVLTSNKNILEAYACEERKDETSGISIVCFTKEHIYVPQREEYAGFPVLTKPYDSVSTESVEAEADRSNIEYDYNVHQEELSKTVSFHVEDLFRNHTNLEAVCGSLVKSTKCGIEKSAPCIVLYCRWKGMVPYGEKEFPKELKGPNGVHSFSTDIREGFFLSGPNGTFLTKGTTDWSQELAMGCSIGHENGQCSATLGPFLNICETDETCFLTVQHLFQQLNVHDSQLRGVKVFQPADGDILIGNNVANHSEPARVRLCGEVLLSRFDNDVDAAVVKINQSRMPTRGNFVGLTGDALCKAGFSPSDLPTFDMGIMEDLTSLKKSDQTTGKIIKFGRQTGLTKGTIDLKNIAVKMKSDATLSMYNNGMKKFKEQTMKQQLKVNSDTGNPFFLCGDSGSAVFLVEDNKLKCIGMAIGFLSDYTCVVTPIQTILKAINYKSPQGVSFELKTFAFEKMHTCTIYERTSN